MTLKELAERIGAELRGDGARKVSGCAGLAEAGEGEISFLANASYVGLLAETRAAAVILADKHAGRAPGVALLVAEDPYFAFREAVVALHGFARQPGPGVSDLAEIHPSARIGEGCSIQPFVYVAEHAVIGDRSVLHPHCYVGARSRVGEDCIFYPSVTVYQDCTVGSRVILHASCSIGHDGFGHATHGGAHHKIPSVGTVVLEDDVELGAGCAVDRATLGATVVGRGTKCSDLVIIGHGAEVGRHGLYSGQAGIAGSAKLGDFVLMGGQTGVSNHVKVGDFVQVFAKSAVLQDVPARTKVMGTPAMDMRVGRRAALQYAKLPEMARRIRELEKRLAALEASSPED